MLECGILASSNPIIGGTPISLRHTKLLTMSRTIKPWKHNPITCSSLLGDINRTPGGQIILPQKYKQELSNVVIGNSGDDDYLKKMEKKDQVFLLDVNPLCYHGSTPSLRTFSRWISLLFSRVSLSCPVIAVLDGDGANEYRRQLLPSYKAHRRKPSTQTSDPGRFHLLIYDVLRKCNVPVVKIASVEADDVIATLAEQALQRGYQVVIASPDKDFKQLISEDVQMVMPITELKRWSFYTLKHYVAQYKCHPLSDLSLRCIMGDEADGVPGIKHFVPGFGLKTALKLLKKHQSLENLLNAASIRTVGKQYIQDALTNYAHHLRNNYQVLSVRRDINVHLQEEWLHERDASNDAVSLSDLIQLVGGSYNPNINSRAHSNGYTP